MEVSEGHAMFNPKTGNYQAFVMTTWADLIFHEGALEMVKDGEKSLAAFTKAFTKAFNV